jgi:16S rRNA G966 N2-methylase RsmD
MSPPAPRSTPDLIAVKRSDPVYNAHGYLTKVPVGAIVPFIEAFTDPGDLVLDPFAGSGMTGVAAAMTGRRSELSDISELGRHIGSGYLNLVDPNELQEAAARVEVKTHNRFPGAYEHLCKRCGSEAVLSRRVWTIVYECGQCSQPVDFYRALETAGWRKANMACPHCHAIFQTRRAKRLGEEPVLDTVSCACSATLVDQAPTDPRGEADPTTVVPAAAGIGPGLQMYQASALGKHGLKSTADFFSPRNLAMLTVLRDSISQEIDNRIRSKLMFAFTAILPRASKRYQWSRQRPLNANNSNYYIAPVFYEWNVLDLFGRKVRAVSRSDEEIRNQMDDRRVDGLLDARYRVGSAASLDLSDGSVDYIFTDPPFGSNIFYSDMNLFQEVWLDRFTDPSEEAVVDRGRAKGRRDVHRYELLLTDALREAHRVLVTDGWISLNFSNTSGALWALVQRAIINSGFILDPERISVLDKGQRSVKGLASGFENVVTADLILSMRKAIPGETVMLRAAPATATATAVSEALRIGATTPTHVYLQVVRSFLRHHWDASDLDIAEIGNELRRRGLDVEASSGRLVQDLLAA